MLILQLWRSFATTLDQEGAKLLQTSSSLLAAVFNGILLLLAWIFLPLENLHWRSLRKNFANFYTNVDPETGRPLDGLRILIQSLFLTLFRRPPIRRHEDEMLIVIPLNREDKRDALLFFKRQEVDDRTPSRIRLSFGQLEDINWVNPARRREAENDVMRIGYEDFLNFIVFRRRLNVTALAATNLSLVVGKLLTLHVAVARKRNDHVTTGNKVALVEIGIAQRINNRASFVAKLLSNRLEFVGNDGAYSGRFRKDVQVVENLVDLRAVVVNDLFTLKPRKAAQIHGQNAVDLSMGKVVVTVFTKTAIGLHRFGIDLMAGGCSAPSDFS